MYRITQDVVVPVVIEIEVDYFIQHCGCCPTIYDFVDKEDTKYYFRLRHGFARIACGDTDETLASGKMHGFDGACSFTDAIEWARTQGVKLIF